LGSLLINRSDLALLSSLLGLLLVIAGFVALIPILACLAFGEWFAVPAFLITFGLFSVLGVLLRLVGGGQGRDIRLKHGMLTAAVAWLLIPLLSGVCFVLVGDSIPPDSHLVCDMTFLDGFFESMSGWTTTGLTMVDDEVLLPFSLQLWRSLMQWVGGVGVVVLGLAILGRPGTGAFSLYMGEGRADKLRPRIVSTARTMLKIYIVYTALATVTFFVLGMPLWGSLNHALTVLPTGGFAVTDNSIQDYDSVGVEIAVIVFMLVGAISFVVHNDVFRRHFSQLWRDVQNKALFWLSLLGGVLLASELIVGVPMTGGVLRAVRLSSFQFVSCLSTTGFQTADLSLWSPSAKIILSLAMIAGGAAGATVGGVKLIRVILLAKGAQWEFLRTFLPKRMLVPKRLGSVVLDDEEFSDIVLEAGSLSFMYLVLLGIGVLALMATLGDISLVDAFFEVCSAQGTVGTSVGLTRAQMPAPAKLMLIINMWTGRLEIFPVLMLLQALLRCIPGRRSRY